ncbi:MAG TPA: hypothetical protein VJ873_01900, partial [bacterium]|nr:hypothetical protein [bacterium]
TLTGLILSVSGTGNPSDITGVTLWENGTAITTTTFTGSTASYSFSAPLPASSSVTFTVTADFGTNASGTFNFSLTGASGSNGHSVQFSGLPVTGALVTVSQPTSTPTFTDTVTPTGTPTSTWTAVFTHTPTFTPTQTVTSTPQSAATPIVFPNPSTGGPVNVLAAAYTGTANVSVEIFTTAFRRVQAQSYANLPYGPIKIEMQDDWQHPLASGLYYVVIQVDGQPRTVTKLLLLR